MYSSDTTIYTGLQIRHLEWWKCVYYLIRTLNFMYLNSTLLMFALINQFAKYL